MDCTLAALLACFSWSGLYIDGQVSYQDTNLPYYYWKDVSPPSRNGVMETARVLTLSDEPVNPYFRNAIGYQLSFKRIDLSAEVFHDSSMASNKDRGVNGIGIRARWFPFR